MIKYYRNEIKKNNFMNGFKNLNKQHEKYDIF